MSATRIRRRHHEDRPILADGHAIAGISLLYSGGRLSLQNHGLGHQWDGEAGGAGVNLGPEGVVAL